MGPCQSSFSKCLPLPYCLNENGRASPAKCGPTEQLTAPLAPAPWQKCRLCSTLGATAVGTTPSPGPGPHNPMIQMRLNIHGLKEMAVGAVMCHSNPVGSTSTTVGRLLPKQLQTAKNNSTWYYYQNLYNY